MFAVDGRHLPRHPLSPSDREDDQLIRAARESKVRYRRQPTVRRSRSLAIGLARLRGKQEVGCEPRKRSRPRLAEMESMRSASEPDKDPLHCATTPQTNASCEAGDDSGGTGAALESLMLVGEPIGLRNLPNSHIAIAVHLSRPHGDLVIDQLPVAVVPASDLRPRLNSLAGDRDQVVAELPSSWRGHDPDLSSEILDLAIRSQPKRGADVADESSPTNPVDRRTCRLRR